MADGDEEDSYFNGITGSSGTWYTKFILVIKKETMGGDWIEHFSSNGFLERESFFIGSKSSDW